MLHPPCTREYPQYLLRTPFMQPYYPPFYLYFPTNVRDLSSTAIIGMYVVPLTESRKIHLIIMLKNGTRIYLRLIGTDRCPTGNVDNLCPYLQHVLTYPLYTAHFYVLMICISVYLHFSTIILVV
jgi:hypothetical protein